MKHLRKLIISLLILTFVVNMIIPAQEAQAASKYGIILGNKSYDYTLYNNLAVISPTNIIMVKANSLCKSLGLTYSYNSTAKKLTIKNPNNGKYLVYTKDSKTYSYYASNTAKATVKTAAYKFYYDSLTKCYIIPAATLKDILTYNFYKDVSDNYYGKMGYKGIIVYSMNGYSSYDMPITDEVLTYVNSKTFTTAKELLDAVRLNLMARKSKVTFNTNRGVMEEIGSSNHIMNLVNAIDRKDTSKDADYLSLLIDNFGQSWQSTSMKYIYPDGHQEIVKSNKDPASLTINVKYESTLTQERIVDSKVASILKSLKLDNATDYEKVKKIHDYIINLASYDTSYAKSTAYDIFVNKTAICEGYTLAAYRLFTDAGIGCKIITGKGGGENHAWNIVLVDGSWYNIDLTWDDPISSTGKQILSYDYFLKNDADFTNHQRLPDFNTRAFLAAYPIAKESYRY